MKKNDTYDQLRDIICTYIENNHCFQCLLVLVHFSIVSLTTYLACQFQFHIADMITPDTKVVDKPYIEKQENTLQMWDLKAETRKHQSNPVTHYARY